MDHLQHLQHLGACAPLLAAPAAADLNPIKDKAEGRRLDRIAGFECAWPDGRFEG